MTETQVLELLDILKAHYASTPLAAETIATYVAALADLTVADVQSLAVELIRTSAYLPRASVIRDTVTQAELTLMDRQARQPVPAALPEPVEVVESRRARALAEMDKVMRSTFGARRVPLDSDDVLTVVEQRHAAHEIAGPVPECRLCVEETAS